MRDRIEETKCASRGCSQPRLKVGFLCEHHVLPGNVMAVKDKTFIITTWRLEHAGDTGLIFINDFAIGDLFGSCAGFEEKLEKQDFSNVHLVETFEELKAVRVYITAPPSWAGPWLTYYPWELQE